jgi:hypothetical protein
MPQLPSVMLILLKLLLVVPQLTHRLLMTRLKLPSLPLQQLPQLHLQLLQHLELLPPLQLLISPLLIPQLQLQLLMSTMPLMLMILQTAAFMKPS